MSVKQCCVSVKTAAVAVDGTTWVNMTLSDWSLSNDALVVVFPPTVVFSRDPNAIAVGVAATSDPANSETEIPGVCTAELRTGKFTCVGGLKRVAFAISGPSAAQGFKDASTVSIGDVQCSMTAFCLSPSSSDFTLASMASSPTASDSALASSPTASEAVLASMGSSSPPGTTNTLLPTASRSVLRPTSSVMSIETPPQSTGDSSNNSNNSNTVALAVSLTAVATIVLCLLILLMHRKREWFKGVLMKKATISQAGGPSNNHWDQDGANSPDDAEEGASSVSTDFLVASASYPGSYRNGPFLLNLPVQQQPQTYPSFTPTSPHPIFQPQQTMDVRNSSTRSSSFNHFHSNPYHSGAALSVRHLSLDRNNQSRTGDAGLSLTTRHQSLERPNHMNRWSGPNGPNGPTPFLHLPSSLVREGHDASGERNDNHSDMDEVTSAGEHQQQKERKIDNVAVQPKNRASFASKPLLDFSTASPSVLAPPSSPSQALYEKLASSADSAPQQSLKTPMIHPGPALAHGSPHTPLASGGLAPPSYTSTLMFPPPLISGVVQGVAQVASSPSAGMHATMLQMPVPPVPVATVPAEVANDGSRTVPQTSNEAIEFALLQRRMKKLADRERRRRVVSYGYGGDSSTEGSEYDEETNSSAEDGEDDEDDADYLEDENEEEALMFLQQQLRMQHAAGAGFGFGGLMNFVPGTTRVVGADGFTGAANAAGGSNGGVGGLGDRFETDGDDLPLAAMALRALQESMKQKQI
ncbi:hypothetical protein HDU81_009896 [Chytriomyces hyalinus]|nr:hypothetical protein HDU81_009896 [Chytriomyces hyalinus]